MEGKTGGTMTETLRLDVTGLNCGGCVRRAEAALGAVPGVSAARVNLATKRAEVDHNGLSPQVLADALAKAGYPAATEDIALSVTGAHCGSCTARIEAALHAVPGVEGATFNLASGRAQVRAFSGAVSPSDLISALAGAGYQAVPLESTDSRAAREAAEMDALRRDVLLAAALTLPVVVLAMGGHIWPPFHHWIAQTIGISTSWMVQFILTTLVLFGPGWRFFKTGIPALMHRAPDMNALVVLGASAAWAFSTVATFVPAVLPEGAADVYFEAAAVIVTLILLGRWLEARARGRAGAAIRKLAGLQVRTARVRRDGDWQEMPVDALVLGDEIDLPPGARVPTDGEIIEGRSELDESAVTGEPLPVGKSIGAAVIGGTVNGAGPLVIRATATGQDTMLAQIMRAVEEAQGAKLPIQSLVDRVTAVFVPVVLVLAGLTLLAWLAFGAGIGAAVVAAVSVLVVACPCAMGLAVPTSIMVGTGRASELGVLFRRGDALQALRDVTVVAFDKTGTLTLGAPALTGMAVLPGQDKAELLALFAALEARSEHAIARAIVAEAQAQGLSLGAAEEVQAHVGEGVSGTVSGSAIRVGAARFFDSIPSALSGDVDAWEAEGRSVLFGAVDGTVVAALAISDTARPEAAQVVADLKQNGVRVAMITGDTAAAAGAVARALGIDDVRASVMPVDKAAAVQELAQGGKIAFVGDGINDAPALAAADVGIAMGGGTDVAMEAADVVLVRPDLSGVATARRLSQRTMSNIKQNLFWAFAYNVALIPVAAGLLAVFGGPSLSPMLASGAMAASSVLVVSNALRLRRVA